MKSCPCGSQKLYENCCLPIHQSHANAHIPEQLMRARYCAHELGLVDFVVNTYHPDCHAEQEREAIADSIHSEWCGLEVLNRQPGETDEEGFVHFRAWFKQSGQRHCLEERSRFVRENGLWFYIDGEFPASPAAVKAGRNNPCPCGSGKKFKKCCG